MLPITDIANQTYFQENVKVRKEDVVEKANSRFVIHIQIINANKNNFESHDLKHKFILGHHYFLKEWKHGLMRNHMWWMGYNLEDRRALMWAYVEWCRARAMISLNSLKQITDSNFVEQNDDLWWKATFCNNQNEYLLEWNYSYTRNMGCQFYKVEFAILITIYITICITVLCRYER